jgi:hypothetical protein
MGREVLDGEGWRGGLSFTGGEFELRVEGGMVSGYGGTLSSCSNYFRRYSFLV